MEGVFAIVFLFGGASLIGFSFSPLGRALADRIRHGALPHGAEPDLAVYEELERVRGAEGAIAQPRDERVQRVAGQELPGVDARAQ